MNVIDLVYSEWQEREDKNTSARALGQKIVELVEELRTQVPERVAEKVAELDNMNLAQTALRIREAFLEGYRFGVRNAKEVFTEDICFSRSD